MQNSVELQVLLIVVFLVSFLGILLLKYDLSYEKKLKYERDARINKIKQRFRISSNKYIQVERETSVLNEGQRQVVEVNKKEGIRYFVKEADENGVLLSVCNKDGKQSKSPKYIKYSDLNKYYKPK